MDSKENTKTFCAEGHTVSADDLFHMYPKDRCVLDKERGTTVILVFCSSKKKNPKNIFSSCHHLVFSINKYGFSALSSVLATTALGSESVFCIFSLPSHLNLCHTLSRCEVTIRLDRQNSESVEEQGKESLEDDKQKVKSKIKKRG